jgi:hypothetical protein
MSRNHWEQIKTDRQDYGNRGDGNGVACVKFCKLILVSGEKLLLCQSRP